MDGVTVVVPIYNVNKYLRRALESYINQSLINKEILLIDDGSTDGSEIICDEYAANYENVMVYHLKNSGVSKARNFAISKANYTYLVFLDADDYMEKNALEEMYARVLMDGSDQVICGYYMETWNKAASKNFEYVLPQNKVLGSFEEFNHIELWDNSLMYNVWNKLYKIQIVKNNNIYFNDMKLGEDLDFNMRYMECCSMISVINQCFYHYIRDREGSATTAYIKDWFEIRNEEHNRLLQYFQKHKVINNELLEFLHRRYIERVIGCIENEFHNKNASPFRATLQFIRYVVHKEEVEKSLQIIRPKSKKIAIMIIPLKIKSTILTYIMGMTITCVRSTFPYLFVGLKITR